MKLMNTVVFSSLVGLSLALAFAVSAEPKGEGPPRGATSGKKPPDSEGPHGPRGPKGKGPKAEPGAPGRGPEGAPGRPHDGPPGHGMERPGRGPHGDGPMGRPFERLKELEGKEKAGTLTEEEKAELEKLRKAPGHFGPGRRARLAELEEKEKAGTLTDEEKAELEKARKVQEHFEQLRERHEERGKDRAERRRSAQREVMKRFPGHQRGREEFRKHARRLAHLERARELAEAAGKTELVARIDQLIEKENARHAKWLEHHQNPSPAKGATP